MIADLVLLFADALVIFAGIGVGARIQARRTPRVKPPRPKDLTCGCDHELAYHDPKTGVCHSTEEVGHREAYGKQGGIRYVTERVQCPCKVYTGDLPDDWYARILGESA